MGPNGTVDLTWDYGPSATEITYICAAGGSCGFATGDLNVVMQRSTDGGRPGAHIARQPGLPGQRRRQRTTLLSSRTGRIYVHYQGYTYRGPSSTHDARRVQLLHLLQRRRPHLVAPVRIGPRDGTMNTVRVVDRRRHGIDSGGNLYATWDTQGSLTGGGDIGWLSYSTDHGRAWIDSASRRRTPTTRRTSSEVSGGRRGIAYVGWLANNSRHGHRCTCGPPIGRAGCLRSSGCPSGCTATGPSGRGTRSAIDRAADNGRARGGRAAGRGQLGQRDGQGLAGPCRHRDLPLAAAVRRRPAPCPRGLGCLSGHQHRLPGPRG